MEASAACHAGGSRVKPGKMILHCNLAGGKAVLWSKQFLMKSILAITMLVSVAATAQSSKEGDFHLDKEYTITATGTLELQASDAKVFIVGSPRATAHVKIDREVTTKGLFFGTDEFRVDVTERDGNLSIREHSHSSASGIVGYYNEKYTINLEVPEGVSLMIKGDDGDYFIKTVHGSISLDLDDADVELTECKGNQFNIKLDDGDLRMDRGRGLLEVDADDADIDIKNASFTTIHARVDDGDFIVETTLAENGNYTVYAQDGLVAMRILGGGGRFDIRHDDARVSTEGGFEIVDRSERRTQITTASGTARIDIRADDARIRLVR